MATTIVLDMIPPAAGHAMMRDADNIPPGVWMTSHVSVRKRRGRTREPDSIRLISGFGYRAVRRLPFTGQATGVARSGPDIGQAGGGNRDKRGQATPEPGRRAPKQ